MLGENGDRFILNMRAGEIMDLAEQMIRLSGKTPGQEIAIEITGLGPGEKQHERLHASDEQLEASNSQIQRIRGDRLMPMLATCKANWLAGGTEWRRRHSVAAGYVARISGQ